MCVCGGRGVGGGEHCLKHTKFPLTGGNLQAVVSRFECQWSIITGVDFPF